MAKSNRRQAQVRAWHSLPEPKPTEEIMRVHAAQGGNLYSLEAGTSHDHSDKKSPELYVLPKKLRHVIYIKTGSFVIAKSYQTKRGKIMGEIVEALLDDHVKALKKTDRWPESFGGDENVDDAVEAKDSVVDTEEEGNSLENLENPNRRQRSELIGSSDDDSSSDDVSSSE